MAIARGLRETVIETTAPGAGGMNQHAVEHLALALVFVESFKEKMA